MPVLSLSDFTPDQLSGWVAASDRCAGPDFGPAADEAPADGEWFVAYTNPKREGAVERTCRQRGLDAYVPAMTVTQRRQTARRPVFPRYVFVRLRDGLTLYSLCDTPGLEALVRVSGKPVTVSSEMVVGLRAYEADGTWDFTAERRAREDAMEAAYAEGRYAAQFVPGFKVRICNGPYNQFPGIVAEFFDPTRVTIRMKLFGREFEIPLPLADIEPFC